MAARPAPASRTKDTRAKADIFMSISGEQDTPSNLADKVGGDKRCGRIFGFADVPFVASAASAAAIWQASGKIP
jgi:hypothetical protein